MLRRWREAYGLGLERAGQLLRTAAEEEGLRAPAANFQTLSQHERGEVYPGPHYRAAYCRLYQANEAELGFRRPLPGETARDAPPDRADDDDVRRREFLGSALVGSAAVVTAVVVPSF